MPFAVPPQLADLPQWICWRHERRNGKTTKLPFQVDGAIARSNDPSTWSTLRAARRAYVMGRFDGVGFVFAKDGGLVGIDLDSCIDIAGEVAPWAAEIVEQFNTYAEVSPSGHGVKLYLKGNIEQGRKKLMPGDAVDGKSPGIEVYGSGRFFCFTGDTWPGSPMAVQPCKFALAGLLATHWPAEPSKPAERGSDAIRQRNGHPPYERLPLHERARRYLAKTPGAVWGDYGGAKTYRAACVLVRDIGLSVDEAYPLMEAWNATCRPPWSEAELKRKLCEAVKVVGTGDPRAARRGA